MCGITGIITFDEKGKKRIDKIESSVTTLIKRGPDAQGIYRYNNVALGHRRLSIIDTSNAAAQPFTDHTDRYTIIFNGEFFNYKEHRNALLKKGVPIRSSGDTEVLLYLFIEYGVSFLEKINGFYSLAIYDKQTEELFIARDRYGIKPLLLYTDEHCLAFASEMKALLAFQIPKEIDKSSLYTYLQLNYIPSPVSIFNGVTKLEPGHYLRIKNGLIEKKCYYAIPYREVIRPLPDYQSAQHNLVKLLEDSVQNRLIADVPLGCFLSGGIDSSIITALAAKHSQHLKTFSIGYKDEPLFDETHYAQLVAKMHKTDHTVFSLSNNDLFNNLHQVLDYIDEPFADSSALAVYILSMHTRKHVTVALSGDGADELFAGYNKHAAEYKIRNNKFSTTLISSTGFLWNKLPQSRNSVFGNKIRQLNKFSEGVKLTQSERYWRWAGYCSEQDALHLFNIKTDLSEYAKRKKNILKNVRADFNSLLLTDMNLVLQNDMLTKVDSMSMANSLEVRVPFLDYNVVNFAFSLPAEYKINGKNRKRILKDAFRAQLPPELYERTKHGFEVPLLKWFKTELKSMITDDLLSEKFIEEQNLFNYQAIEKILIKLFSRNPGDSVSRIWGLIVFQYWWKRYMR